MANVHSINLENSVPQCLEIDDASQSGLDIIGDITIECWVKFESIGADTQQIVSKWYGQPTSANRSYYFAYLEYNDTLGVGIGNSVNTVEFPASGTAGITTGTWFHVAWTWDASASTSKFYVNGEQVGSDVVGAITNIRNAGAKFRIGAAAVNSAPDTLIQPFDGLIDEVRVWNVVRSVTEIADNMEVQIDSASGLVGSWHFEEVLTDSSGNGNTLTNIGSATYSTDVPFGGATSAIKSVAGVAYASLKKISGVAIASVKKVCGLS